MSSLRNIFSGFKSLKNSYWSAWTYFFGLAFLDGKIPTKKWSWASPKARCKYSACLVFNLDINLLIGILPFSTLKTLWDGTTEEVHPMLTSFSKFTKGVNTSLGQNHLQYHVITSIDTFLIYLWIIFLSCRYLQPIRIWRLLHEEYSFTLSLKKRYWRMSYNQTSSISQKNRTSLKREFDRPGEQNIWLQTLW